MMTEHTAKAFDDDLQELTRMVAEMGGLAEKQIADVGRRAGAPRRRPRRSAWSPTDPTHRRAAARDRGEGRSSPSRGGSRWRSICARSSARCASSNDLERIGDLAKNIAKRVLRARRRFPSAASSIRGVEHMAALVLGAAQGGARRLCRPRSRRGARGVERRRGDRRACAPRCSASC